MDRGDWIEFFQFTTTPLNTIPNYQHITAVCPVDRVLAFLAVRNPGTVTTTMIKIVSLGTAEILREFSIQGEATVLCPTSITTSFCNNCRCSCGACPECLGNLQRVNRLGNLYAILTDQILYRISFEETGHGQDVHVTKIMGNVSSETEMDVSMQGNLYFVRFENGNQRIFRTPPNGTGANVQAQCQSLISHDVRQMGQIRRICLREDRGQANDVIQIALMTRDIVYVYDRDFTNLCFQLNSSPPGVFMGNYLLVYNHNEIQTYDVRHTNNRAPIALRDIPCTGDVKSLKKWGQILWIYKDNKIVLYIAANASDQRVYNAHDPWDDDGDQRRRGPRHHNEAVSSQISVLYSRF